MSKVEVNTIEPQCGTTLTVGKCTTSVAVPGNVVKSNALQASDGGNIVSQSGTDITLGASGDTINLASGATQSGFGRTGTVDWDTTKITADPANAVSGTGYFCDTSGGAFTVTLPTSPSAGDIVAVADYTRTFESNNLTIGRNSKPIGGVAQDGTLNVDGQSATFVFVDDTEGWINIQETQTSQTGLLPFIEATGGTITTSGNDKIHKFTGPGTFTVCRIATCCAAVNNLVSFIVVAGGGGSGNYGGGGGGGGTREVVSPGSPYTGSPLNGYPTPGNRITVTATGYPITVGAGGGAGGPEGSNTYGANGSNSIFSTITSTGGGGGGGNAGGASCHTGKNGGSGGGESDQNSSGSPGSGNTPPTTPPQGTNGGTAGGSGGPHAAGGGGGATAVGGNGSACGPQGAGGAGATTEITASPVGYGGGGSGGGSASTPGSGSPCGSGGAFETAGATNRGGGGGGSNTCDGGEAGGSGVVILRYKFQ